MLRFSILVPLLVWSAAYATEYAPVSVPMEVRQVGEHSYYVMGAPGMATDNEGFISNAGFVITPAGVVVFDALGSPSLAWTLRRKIAELTDQPVVKVIVSHYHADHVYGLQVFQDEGATIIAPRGAYDYLESEAAANRLEERRFSLDPWVNEQTRLVPPDRLVESAERFTLGGMAFRLSYLGSAHSQGDMAMFVVDDAVLYSGDLIFEGRVPFVGDADTRHWLQTLERLETGELQALVPGHGPAARNPKEAIGLTRRYLARLREVMGAAVEDLQGFDSAYDAADWSEFSGLPAFRAAHRRNAYQVYLSMESEALQ
jgi:glyoxylase-like metal-dependent hydrolase (beta-lactamase superfamily II)